MKRLKCLLCRALCALGLKDPKSCKAGTLKSCPAAAKCPKRSCKSKKK